MTPSSSGKGLSLGYRLGYRLRLAALTVLGPAELSEHDDPKARLRRERERKLAAQQERRAAATEDRG